MLCSFVVDWRDADIIVPKIARIVGGGPPSCAYQGISANEGMQDRVDEKIIWDTILTCCNSISFPH